MAARFVNIDHGLDVITGTGGGGLYLMGTVAGRLVAGQVYHLGVTFSTGTNGWTTERIFAASGPGAITTGSSSSALIATGSFQLNPAVVTNTGGFLSSGTWEFGTGYYGDSVSVHTDNYDCLRLYSQDPGVFPAVGQ